MHDTKLSFANSNRIRSQSVWKFTLSQGHGAICIHRNCTSKSFVAGLLLLETEIRRTARTEGIRLFPAPWFFPKAFMKMDACLTISNMKMSPWVPMWNMPNGCHAPFEKSPNGLISQFFNAKGSILQNGKWFRDQIPLYGKRGEKTKLGPPKKNGPFFFLFFFPLKKKKKEKKTGAPPPLKKNFLNFPGFFPM